MKCCLNNLSIGDKFIDNGKLFILLDFSPKVASWSNMLCALDVETFRLVCFLSDYEVEPETEKILI